MELNDSSKDNHHQTPSDAARHTVADSNRRIILWDIDGTLLSSRRIGGFKEYMTPAMTSVFGTSGALDGMRVSGMTDLQIVAVALAGEGFTQQEILNRLPQFRTRLTEEMERATKGREFFELLPGVRETLEAVAREKRYLSSLLTGNLEPAAYIKLVHVGLEKFFTLPGAFGEDSFDRRDLPAIAARRINQKLKMQFAPTQFIVIGDTPNDILCAKHFGCRVVALNTGRLDKPEQLRALEPDALLEDLSDVALLLKTLRGL